MVVVQFPDRVLIYPSSPAPGIWMVRSDEISRDGDLIREAHLTPEAARSYADWIRRAMADQPQRIRERWMGQADRLHEIADLVDLMNATVEGVKAARKLIAQAAEQLRQIQAKE